MSSAAAAIWLSKSGGQAGASTGLRMPAEWQPHLQCVMAFSTVYSRYTKRQNVRIRTEQAAIAKAIALFEPVTMLVNTEDLKAARKLLGTGVELVEMDHHDVWVRDTLPSIALTDENQPVAVSWNFNAWGEKYTGYEADRDLAKRFSQRQGLPLIEAGIVAEGGAFDLDGAGTLITTETCLVNPNRNPGLSRSDIEAELRRLTGAMKVIWLHGSDADKVTNGHVDALARFVKPGVVMVEVSEDPYEPEYRDLLENLHRLEGCTDATGKTIEVIRVKRPRWDIMGERGGDFAASYVNSYFPNGGIIMPRFGDPDRDYEAREIFQRLMPGRKIVQLRVDEICEGGGGIHCNTQHIPAK